MYNLIHLQINKFFSIGISMKEDNTNDVLIIVRYQRMTNLLFCDSLYLLGEVSSWHYLFSQGHAVVLKEYHLKI